MEPENYQRMAEFQQNHWWYRGRRAIIARQIERLNLPPGATVLEAGCGPGGNLDMLKRFGTVSAFDPDDFARDFAARLSGVVPQPGSLPAPVPFTDPFDLVCALDVIEHIDDDLNSLKTLRRLTAPGGYAVFSVPTYMFLWSRHDETNHHKRRYTKTSFARVLRGAGFEIEFMSYYNTLLFPPIAVVRGIKKLFRIDAPDETMPPAAVNAALRYIFSFERFLLRPLRLPFGVSIVAVCR